MSLAGYFIEVGDGKRESCREEEGWREGVQRLMERLRQHPETRIPKEGIQNWNSKKEKKKERDLCFSLRLRLRGWICLTLVFMVWLV